MITGTQFRNCIVSGANNITNKKSAVDELNVFPVPDGDTGTNMSMTINFAVRELGLLEGELSVEQVANTASSALLRGARGNSGVILSLLFRGFSKGMAGKKEADSECIARSLSKGVESAYKAVMKPTEGTILTVAREAAEKAMEQYAQLSPVETFELILEQAKETLECTPEMLPVLKKAGVVDSGGYGFVVILEGMVSYLRDGKLIELEGADAAPSGAAAASGAGRGVYTEDIDPNMTEEYCTEFLIIKNEKPNDAVKLRAALEKIGNSIVVVEDDDLIKVHVHTKTPNKALAAALENGYLSKIKIENMLEQYMELQAAAKAGKTIDHHDKDLYPELASTAAKPEPPKPENDEGFPYAAVDPDIAFGFVAVSSGDGLRSLFGDLGADRVVSGGQTMNPSTDDILAAIQSVPAKNVIVLPNNKNIIMAAEQACTLADRAAVAIPTRSVSQGISAMLAYDPDAGLDDNVIAMKEAAERVNAGQITYAARDSNFDDKDIKEGSILALENGKLAFTDTSVPKAAARLAKKLCTKDASFVTVIYGADVSEAEANEALELIKQRLPKHVDTTLVNGGQPVYYYYISAE